MADDSHSITVPDSTIGRIAPDAKKSGEWQPIGDVARRLVERARKQREAKE